MSRPVAGDEEKPQPEAPLPLWGAILLVIVLVCGVVGLFGALVFLLINGALQLGLPPVVYLVIFVTVSGIFAWLIKRLADIFLKASRLWFSDESNE